MGGRGGGVAPRPVVLLSGSLRVASALPSGARVRSGLKRRPGVGGVRGGPWTAPLGAPSDLKPPLCHLGVGCGYGRVTWGAASFLFRCARCSGTPVWVRGSRSSRRCPYRAAVPPEGGGRPPGPGGAEGRACGSPAVVGAGGGVGGPPPRPPSGLCGGGVGRRGPFGPLAMPLVGRGGGAGAAWRSSSWSWSWSSSRPSPAPPIESRMLAQALAGAPHPPAVVARRWPAGGGREG